MANKNGETVRPTSLNISALLNHPNNRNGIIPRPGPRDIPPIYLTSIEPVSINDFAAYIKDIAPDLERYVDSKQYGLHQHLLAQKDTFKKNHGSIFSGTDGLEARVAAQLSSSVTDYVPFDDQSSVRSEGWDSPSSEKIAFDLEAYAAPTKIPSFFCEEEFELKNPRTFDLLGLSSASSSYLPSHDTKQSANLNDDLQEKLSTYVDMLETSLVDEISATTTMFFDALRDLQALSSRASGCKNAIHNLRAELRDLRNEHAISELHSAQNEVTVGNTRVLLNSLMGLKSRRAAYLELATFARDNLVTSDVIEKLLVIETLHNTELGSLKVDGDIGERLTALKFSLGQQDVVRFKTVLMDDLIAQVAALDVPNHLNYLRDCHLVRKRGQSIAYPLGAVESTSKVRESLAQATATLASTSQMAGAFSAYSEAVIKEAKAITKRELPSNEDDDAQSNISGATNRTARDKSTLLARQINSMPGAHFVQMIIQILIKTCGYLRAIAAQQKLLIDLVSSATMDIPTDVLTSIYSSNLTADVADLCQTRVAKILNVRAAANLQLHPNEVREYVEVVSIFLAECETLTGNLGVELQQIMRTQVRAFFTSTNAEMLQALMSSIELDPWQPAQITNTLQAVVNFIVSSRNLSTQGTDLPTFQETCASLTNTSQAGIAKSVLIGDRKFSLPISTAFLFIYVRAVLHLMHILPPIRLDAIQAMFETLRVYNSRSCQLVLGAGATKSAGLERITAKHLAGTSHALSAVLALFSGVKEHMTQSNLGDNERLTALDNIAIAISSHREELHNKLISIMDDRTAAVCQQMSSVPAATIEAGEAGEPIVEPDPSSQVTTLVKDTLVLAKVLSRFLDDISFKFVMQRVLQTEQTRLSEEFQRAAEGKQTQCEADKAYFLEKLATVIESSSASVTL